MKDFESTLQHLRECKAVADRAEPLSPSEQAEFNALRAREMRRAEERRRGPEPQLELPEVA